MTTDQSKADQAAAAIVLLLGRTAGSDVVLTPKRFLRTLLADREQLRVEEVRLTRALTETVDERDRAQDYADRLAAAIAPPDVLGEHSGGNNPWDNALNHASDLGEYDATVDRARLRFEQAEPTKES